MDYEGLINSGAGFEKNDWGTCSPPLMPGDHYYYIGGNDDAFYNSCENSKEQRSEQDHCVCEVEEVRNTYTFRRFFTRSGGIIEPAVRFWLSLPTDLFYIPSRRPRIHTQCACPLPNEKSTGEKLREYKIKLEPDPGRFSKLGLPFGVTRSTFGLKQFIENNQLRTLLAYCCSLIAFLQSFILHEVKWGKIVLDQIIRNANEHLKKSLEIAVSTDPTPTVKEFLNIINQMGKKEDPANAQNDAGENQEEPPPPPANLSPGVASAMKRRSYMSVKEKPEEPDTSKISSQLEKCVLSSFELNSNTAELLIKDPYIIGELKPDEESITTLNEGLKMFFRHYKYGLVSIQSHYYLVWMRYGLYFVYDPNGRDSTTFDQDTTNGATMLFCFRKKENIANLIIHYAKFNTTDLFTIRPVDVKLMRKCKPLDPVYCRERKLDEYEFFNDHHAVLKGRINLSMKCFGGSRNYSHLALCIMAIVFSKIDGPTTWDSYIVDEIALISVRYYREWTKKNCGTDLTINEIPSPFMITIGRFCMKCVLKVDELQGCCERDVLSCMRTQLGQGISNLFKKNRTSMILEIGNYYYALWKRGNCFYIIDSYIHGNEGPPAHNFTSVHMFTKFRLFCSYLQSNILRIAENERFHIHLIKIIRITDKYNLPKTPSERFKFYCNPRYCSNENPKRMQAGATGRFPNRSLSECMDIENEVVDNSSNIKNVHARTTKCYNTDSNNSACVIQDFLTEKCKMSRKTPSERTSMRSQSNLEVPDPEVLSLNKSFEDYNWYKECLEETEVKKNFEDLDSPTLSKTQIPKVYSDIMENLLNADPCVNPDYSCEGEDDDEPKYPCKGKTRKLKLEAGRIYEFQPEEEQEEIYDDGCIPNSYPGYCCEPYDLGVMGSEKGTFESIFVLITTSFRCVDRALLMTPWGNYVVFKSKDTWLLYDGCTCDVERFRHLDLTKGTAGLLCFRHLEDLIQTVLQGKRQQSEIQYECQMIDRIVDCYCSQVPKPKTYCDCEDFHHQPEYHESCPLNTNCTNLFERKTFQRNMEFNFDLTDKYVNTYNMCPLGPVRSESESSHGRNCNYDKTFKCDFELPKP